MINLYNVVMIFVMLWVWFKSVDMGFFVCGVLKYDKVVHMSRC